MKLAYYFRSKLLPNLNSKRRTIGRYHCQDQRMIILVPCKLATLYSEILLVVFGPSAMKLLSFLIVANV